MKAIVTDHALIRWLERVHEMEMEQYREILAQEVTPYVGSQYAKKDGMIYKFDGPRLITVTPDLAHPRKWKRTHLGYTKQRSDKP